MQGFVVAHEKLIFFLFVLSYHQDHIWGGIQGVTDWNVNNRSSNKEEEIWCGSATQSQIAINSTTNKWQSYNYCKLKFLKTIVYNLSFCLVNDLKPHIFLQILLFYKCH